MALAPILAPALALALRLVRTRTLAAMPSRALMLTTTM